MGNQISVRATEILIDCERAVLREKHDDLLQRVSDRATTEIEKSHQLIRATQSELDCVKIALVQALSAIEASKIEPDHATLVNTVTALKQAIDKLRQEYDVRIAVLESKNLALSRSLEERNKTLKKYATRIEAVNADTTNAIDAWILRTFEVLFSERLSACIRKCFAGITAEQVLSVCEAIDPNGKDGILGRVFCIDGFLCPYDIILRNYGPFIFFQCLLSHTLARKFVENPFWMCKRYFGRLLSEFFEAYQKTDREKAILWRASTINLLQVMMNETKATDTSHDPLKLHQHIDPQCDGYVDVFLAHIRPFLEKIAFKSPGHIEDNLMELKLLLQDIMEFSLLLNIKPMQTELINIRYLNRDPALQEVNNYRKYSQCSVWLLDCCKVTLQSGRVLRSDMVLAAITTPGITRVSRNEKYLKVPIPLVKADIIVSSKNSWIADDAPTETTESQ